MTMTRFEIRSEDGGELTEDQMVMACSAAQIRLVRNNLVTFCGLNDQDPGVARWLLGILDQTAEGLQVQSRTVYTEERTEAAPDGDTE